LGDRLEAICSNKGRIGTNLQEIPDDDAVFPSNAMTVDEGPGYGCFVEYDKVPGSIPLE
jgi:hypothetical protein